MIQHDASLMHLTVYPFCIMTMRIYRAPGQVPPAVDTA